MNRQQYTASEITEKLTELVKIIAWFIYIDRTQRKTPGSPERDWLRAEMLVRPYKPCIEADAYYRYLDRVLEGKPEDPLMDWLEAEAFLAVERSPLYRLLDRLR